MEGIIMSDNLAVKKIIEAIQQEEIVEACYIKENQDDKYSHVCRYKSKRIQAILR